MGLEFEHEIFKHLLRVLVESAKSGDVEKTSDALGVAEYVLDSKNPVEAYRKIRIAQKEFENG